MLVYADNAATTKLSAAALDAMLPYYTEIWANPSSLHTPGLRAAEKLSEARERTAKILGCEAREIIFTSGGSEANNQALVSGARAGEKKGRRHIVSTSFEHHSVLHTLKALEKEGFEVTLVDVGKDGVVDAEKIENAIRPDTCLVSVMYANNEIGTVQPISDIGRICRNKGITFHTDAVQAVGHVEIDVNKENIDMLSLSAHKFEGPRGVGVLYAKRGVPLTSIIYGGAQERGQRAGTENLPAVIGMTAALEESVKNMKENNEKTSRLRDRLIEGLSKIPHSALNGSAVKRLPGNVNFSFEGIEGESLLILLDDRGIAASSGSACASASLDPSHVLLAIGRPHEVAHGSLRLSLSHLNTEAEVDYIIKCTSEVVERLRSMSPVWRDLESGEKEFMLK